MCFAGPGLSTGALFFPTEFRTWFAILSRQGTIWGNTVKRLFRTGAIISLNAALVAVLLLAGLEVLLRVFLGGAIPIQRLPQDPVGSVGSAADLKLAPNPQHVTNPAGLWVANSNRPTINADGFRSPPLDEPARGRKTLVFIGDSFTWGLSANPLSEAFPDVVRRAGYKVCNLGISGLATVQYRAEAETFVPRIKPDAVCLMFYVGNDFDLEPPIVPGFPRNYETSVVELRALELDGRPISFASAASEFARWYGRGMLPALRRAAHATATYTLVQVLTGNALSGEAQLDLVRDNIRAVKRVTEENGAQFLLFLVPTRAAYAAGRGNTLAAAELLKELSPIVPRAFADPDYAPLPDAHFNNAGHAHYAEFILDRLRERGLPPHVESQRP